MNKKTLAASIAGAVLFIALFGYATVAGAKIGEVMGVIARKGDAEISVMKAGEDAVTVERVKAPRPSFVVVHESDEGMPGKRLGFKSIPAGESTDVVVDLDEQAMAGGKVLVAVHIDRGNRGEFEFDMEKTEHSPDRPYYVDGMELAMEVPVE